MNIYLHPELKKYFSSSESLFDQIMALRGECFRHQDGRMTQRILIGDKTYFIKQHIGVGWKEIFKNLFQGRLPVLSAKNECMAIKKLAALNIPVANIVGYGVRGFNPARLESFIIMEDISPSVSLEEVCRHPYANKRWLITEVARIARIMHDNGVNHRDFYLCHFLLKDNILYLIDLHRAQIRKSLPKRWRVKDLAGLYFSSKDCGLSHRDLLRFMIEYRHSSLKSNFWETVKEKGEQLYREHQ